MLLEGEHVPADIAAAHRWALAAAGNGVAAAMTRLGMLYHSAIGVERDPAIAADWWRRGAELGDADAQAMLGAAHHLGSGVPRDRVAALAWLLRGAGRRQQPGRAVPRAGPCRAVRREEIAEAESRARRPLPEGVR